MLTQAYVLEKVRQELQFQPMFHWEAFADPLNRAVRVCFTFRRLGGSVPGSIAYDHLFAANGIDDCRLNVWEVKERALLACLKKAYPDPPRSLWWHMRAWWRGR